MTPDNSSTSSTAWENYWRGSQQADSIGSGGPQDPALKQFWTEFFDQQLPALDGMAILDVGCGSGAVTEFALAAAQSKSASPAISCLDASASAIAHIKQQYPAVTAVCASAASTSLGDESFDHIVSQFGLEYAGADAPAGNGALAAARRYLNSTHAPARWSHRSRVHGRQKSDS